LQEGVAVVAFQDEWQRLLFANWVQSLLTERFGLHGTQGTWEFLIDQAGRKVTLDIKPPAFQLKWSSSDEDRPAVEAIIKEARRRTQARDLGPGTWFQTRFTSQVGWSTDVYNLHVTRFMMEHRQRRPSGRFRFTDEILLDFEQGQSNPGPINPPDFIVNVTLRAPGPGPGPFTTKSAKDLATILRAAIAYWTAAFLEHEPGGLVFPPNQEDVATAQQHLSDPEVTYIAAEGIALGPRIFEFAASSGNGDFELFRRTLGGLYAYEQALNQVSEYVAIVMLVSAIEALSIPNTRWEGKRKTARFIRFVLDSAPATLDQIIAHNNFPQAFGSRRSQKKFLNEIYNRRSRPLHTGFMQHNVEGFFGGLTGAPMRIALVSGLVRDCISSFITSPFSPLIGHPGVDREAKKGSAED
jgi:hypothetical protein